MFTQATELRLASASRRANRNLARLPPRFFPPVGQLLDRNRAFGVKGAITAVRTTHRELVGERAEILDGNERTAFPACDHAALVGGFWQEPEALRRHKECPCFQSATSLAEIVSRHVKNTATISRNYNEQRMAAGEPYLFTATIDSGRRSATQARCPVLFHTRIPS